MSGRLLFFSIPIILITLSFSCKSPSGPDVPKNPREYTWDATMLTYPNAGQTRMFSIWGSSAQDVYVSGFNSLPGGEMYHYDGNQWRPVSLPSGYNYLWKIIGFASNDIWVAAQKPYFDPIKQKTFDSAAVLHYDGKSWSQILSSHMGARALKSMGGNSPQNLYFGSVDGKVIHYDGIKWSIDTLYLNLSINAIGGDEARAFAIGNTWKGVLNDSVMCFTKTTNGWSLYDIQLVTDHSIDPHFGLLSLYSPSPGIFYSCDYRGIFLWQTTKWVKVFNLVGTIIGLGGSGANNILGVGWRDGPLVYHWDGANWDEIKLPQGLLPNDVELYNAWTNGREAFIVGNNGGVSYILHGK